MVKSCVHTRSSPSIWGACPPSAPPSLHPWADQLGFTYFIPLSELCDVSSTAAKAVHRMIDHWEYDSRKETPFIWEYDSIKETPFICTRNEAEGSYMNSNLQYFRNICLRLQNIIYNFQRSDNCAVTEDLTKPFVRDAYDFFVQNDVQGLTIIIRVKLEDKAKFSTPQAGRLHDVSNKAHNVVLKLFVEIGHGLDTLEKSKDTLAFKLYDPKNELCFAGGLSIMDPWNALKILRKLNKMARSALYEQVGGFTRHEQMAGFALGVIFAGTFSKCSNDLTLGMFHSSLKLFKYTCQSSSSSKSSGLRNLPYFQKDKNSQPPLVEVVAGNCTELPQEILMNIFDLLETPDLVRAGSVCCFWNSVYTSMCSFLMNIFDLLETPDLVRAGSVCCFWNSVYTSMCSFGRYKWPQTPCLIYTNESAGENVAFLHSLAEKRAYKLTLPEPPIHRRYLIGSSQGWLVTADERSEMQLVNPITSEQISLPSVITIEQVTPIFDETGVICKYRYSKRTAKSVIGPPSTHSLSTLRDYLFHKALVFNDTSAGGYIVVLIHSPFGQLSFARLGDEKWTWLPPHANFEDCIYKDGLLYAATSLGQIFSFDLRGTVVLTKIIRDRQEFSGMERVYIVEDPCGDLLLVRRPEVWIKESSAEHEHDAYDDQATFENRTWEIGIYKVSIASRKLVQINRLDGYVLFLGHNQSLCFRAEEYPQVKPNHVYFTDDSKSVSLKSRLCCRLAIGALNLETKTMDEIVSPRPWSHCMAPLLIIPNPRKMHLAPDS